MKNIYANIPTAFQDHEYVDPVGYTLGEINPQNKINFIKAIRIGTGGGLALCKYLSDMIEPEHYSVYVALKCVNVIWEFRATMSGHGLDTEESDNLFVNVIHNDASFHADELKHIMEGVLGKF